MCRKMREGGLREGVGRKAGEESVNPFESGTEMLICWNLLRTMQAGEERRTKSTLPFPDSLTENGNVASNPVS